MVMPAPRVQSPAQKFLNVLAAVEVDPKLQNAAIGFETYRYRSCYLGGVPQDYEGAAEGNTVLPPIFEALSPGGNKRFHLFMHEVREAAQATKVALVGADAGAIFELATIAALNGRAFVDIPYGDVIRKVVLGTFAITFEAIGINYLVSRKDLGSYALIAQSQESFPDCKSLQDTFNRLNCEATRRGPIVHLPTQSQLRIAMDWVKTISRR